jgi:sulfur carrier protein
LQIVVNGESRSIDTGTVLQFLESLAIDPARVAVELNQEILPKGEYASTLLQDGDRIEIVHFVGGG